MGKKLVTRRLNRAYSRTLLFTAASACVMGVASPALAQAVATPTPAPSAQKVASNEVAAPHAQVEEVIVTARKREESVQRVPIAITAFTGQLKQADVRNLSDLVAYTPNVRIDSYQQRAGAADITIRGISPSRLDDNSIDSPIGVMIDGIYLGTLVGQLIDNFDLQRIEVLRGPQGTLFGRNTVGGALNVIRTEPTGEWGAKVSYTTGSWNDQEFRGVFNAPLVTDVLALKLYLFTANRDGFIHNTTLNINEPQRDYKNFGGSLKFTPNDKFKAVFSFDKYEDRSQAGTFLTNYNTGAGVLGPYKTPSDINAPGTALAGDPAMLDTYLPGLLQYAIPGSTPLQDVPARTNLAIPTTIDTNNPQPGDVQTWAYTLNMNYRISDHLNLVSLTGLRWQRELETEDFDGSSTDFIDISTQAHYHQVSEELRAEGQWDGKLGKLNLVLGAYYFNNYFTRRWETTGEFWTFVSDISGYDLEDNLWAPLFATPINGQSPIPFTGYSNPLQACLSSVPRDPTPVAAGHAPTQGQALWAVFGRVQCDPGGPQGGAPGVGGYGPGLANILYESQGTDSVAGFAHGDWQFYPGLTLTAGVRYTYERKHFIGYQSYIAPEDRLDINDFPGDADLTNSWSQVTPTAALSYQINPNLMVYGSFSEGWHSGGFFGVNQNSADFLTNQYKPETSKSFEIGEKGQFFDRRLQFNLTGFLTDFYNKQESSIQFDKTTNTVVTLFTNVGGLRYEGVEGELKWVVTPQLDLAGSFGYLHARYTSLLVGYPSNQTGSVPIVNATFLIPRDSPDWTLGGSATYTIPVGPGEWSTQFRADWVDTVQGDLYNASQFVVPAHVDLAASMSYSFKTYKITAFGRNLTNWQHETPTFVSPLFASGTFVALPRSWGLELSATF
jgi:outer membrane receptor protein involved in Fe transport